MLVQVSEFSFVVRSQPCSLSTCTNRHLLSVTSVSVFGTYTVYDLTRLSLFRSTRIQVLFQTDDRNSEQQQVRATVKLG